jgi:hypothetical protein
MATAEAPAAWPSVATSLPPAGLGSSRLSLVVDKCVSDFCRHRISVAETGYRRPSGAYEDRRRAAQAAA